MIPANLSLVSTRALGDQFVPHYLTETDYPWLRVLLDEYARFVGRRRTELCARMREPLPTFAPKAKLRIAAQVLDALSGGRTVSALPPREARWRVFRAASRVATPREAVLQSVAEEAAISRTDLEAALFADLPGERCVAPLPDDLSPARLALDANLVLVSSLLRRARRVKIAAWGNTRALVRHARLIGLICIMAPAAAARPGEGAMTGPTASSGPPDRPSEGPADGVILDISGPFALFHHTEVYGRALASLVPRTAWCHQFELVAQCAIGRTGVLANLVIRSGDPIRPGRELRRHDSKLEERFAEDFRRAAPEWDVVREPRPLDAGGTWIYPDFELVHRHDAGRRWLLEIVGFWTPSYLDHKLRRLQAAGLERFVLCIDEKRCCQEADLPPQARIIRYKTRIPPSAVLAIIAPTEAVPAPRRMACPSPSATV